MTALGCVCRSAQRQLHDLSGLVAEQAGFDAFPTSLPDFLRLAKQLSRTSIRWACLRSLDDDGIAGSLAACSFGAPCSMKPIIPRSNRPGRSGPGISRELIPFHRRHVDLDRRQHNKAFMAGEIGCTNNPISIYTELAAAAARWRPTPRTPSIRSARWVKRPSCTSCVHDACFKHSKSRMGQRPSWHS